MQAQETTPQRDDGVAAPAWLEPRGLNVVDLVGLVPEAHLRDAILSYNGAGILQYVSGQRSGSTVTLQVKASPQYWSGNTHIGCPGQQADFDQWPSPVPAGTVRVYAAGKDITSSAGYLEYWATGQIWPERNPYGNPAQRYGKQGTSQFTFSGGALQLPANAGCILSLRGIHENLTATFTYQTINPIVAHHLGSQTYQFHSYIGPGGAGRLDSLRQQMQARWPHRHDKFPITPPAEADYALVIFPPSPVTVGPWTEVDRNFPQPSGGTYRLSGPVNNVLSVDHINSMGLPIRGQWQDADQAPGTSFLPFFNNAAILASPEYFLPPGVPYHPCMTNGGCSNAILEQVYSATAPMTIHYYKVERTQSGLTRIPLKQVGPAWSGARTAQTTVDHRFAPTAKKESKIYLPFVIRYIPPPAPEPDNPNGCPCGWFDDLGRMFDYIPPQ